MKKKEKHSVNIIEDFPSESEEDLYSDDDLDDATFSINNNDNTDPLSQSDCCESENEITLEDETVLPDDENEKWYSNKENSYANNIPAFENYENQTPTANGSEPLDFFLKMFPDSLIENITFETNRYAIQSGHLNLKVSKEEMYIFLGINIAMTYIKYPNQRMYWSSNAALRMSMVADSMPSARFFEIQKYLHFVDNNVDSSTEDRYWKLRPIINTLHDTFHQQRTPSEHQSIDEMIVPFKGRSPMKQYIVNKPKRWGFKIWARSCPDGYVNCFELYEGKNSDVTNRCFGAIGDMVWRLCHDIRGRNHKLYMDNLFNSLPLIKYLADAKIFVAGTVRMNRVSDAKAKLKTGKAMIRGESSFVTSSDNVTVLRWKDNKEVHMISTFAGKNPEGTAKRWDRKAKKVIDIPRPYVVEQYNAYMGGVDLMDRMIAHYPHNIKGHKWYFRVFFHLLNIAIVNSWICYKDVDNIPLLNYKAALVYGFMKVGSAKTPPRKRGRPSDQQETIPCKKARVQPQVAIVRYDGIGHYPKKVSTTSAPRCHESRCRSRTRFLCGKCNEPVCPTCMEPFHTK